MGVRSGPSFGTGCNYLVLRVARHHANWRLKAMQRHERVSDQELAYTAPISIAERDQAVIREMGLNFVQKVLKVVKASEPEEKLMCLNLDWIEI